MTPPRPPPVAVAPAGFFVLRTPLLSFDVLTAWANEVTLPGAAGTAEHLERVIEQDRALLIGRLRAAVTEPEVREALFVASPAVHEALQAWLRDPTSPRAHDVVPVLVRYLLRMAARSAPFGLFAGCSTGALDAHTRLDLPPQARGRRSTRLDMHYLCALAEALERDPSLRVELRFVPSSGLYACGDQLRYAEARTDPQTRERSYQLVGVEASTPLLRTLDRCARGATTAHLAAGLVTDDPSLSMDEAVRYVDLLIDAQILVSELAPVITGPEPIGAIIGTLDATRAGAPVAAKLTEVRDALTALDREPVGIAPSRYCDVAHALAQLPAKTDLARLFQVDLFKPAPGLTLGRNVVAELKRAAVLLSRISARRSDPLHGFRERFRERFDRREVPLAEALDDERGVELLSEIAGSAEPTPLLDELRIPAGLEPPRIPFGPREQHLLTRYAELLRAGHGDWSLDERDIEVLEHRMPASLPDAFAVTATVTARSAVDADKGDFRVWIDGVSGPSGARLLGRFCHGDAELCRAVETHLRAEEALRPHAVFAEIVHLPEGRLGNVLCRPLFRGYEIPYLGRSGAPLERQLPIADLRLSLEGDRFVLRSNRLGCEVIPRLTSAHYHPGAQLAIYRFLCALQVQGSDSALIWSWGPLAAAPVLPRVSYGRLVLSPRRWNIAHGDIETLRNSGASARVRALLRLRRKLELPRWIGLADGDNVLPIDLDNVLSVETFLRLVEQRQQVTLREVPVAEHELFARGPEGRYTHELVVPFVRVRDPSPPCSPSLKPRVKRTFPPGSEWLYVKVYAGTATSDDLLDQLVAPLVEHALGSELACRWFFLRYADPGWHLRLRFQGNPSRLTGELLPRLHDALAPWMADGRVHRVQLDTYEREIERYGGDLGIELAEQVFHIDSEAILSILRRLEPQARADARWRLVLCGMHLLLDDFGLDLDARMDLLARLRGSLLVEHGAGTAFRKQLAGKLRRERAALAALLSRGLDPEHPLASGIEVLAERSVQLAPVVSALRAHEQEGRLAVPIGMLVTSLLHMHANRMLRSEQRAQEMVLYDFLWRLYRSARAARG